VQRGERTLTRRPVTWRGVTLATLVLGLALLLLGPLATGADAGIYRAVQCHGGHGGGDRSSARYASAGATFLAVAECAPRGSGLGVAVPQGGGYGAIGTWALDAPPGTSFRSVSFAGSRQSADGWLAWFVGWKPEGGWEELWMPDNAQVYDYPDSWQRSGPFSGVEAQLVCVSAAGCAGSFGTGVFMHDLAFDIADSAPPSVAVSGSLLTPGVKRGTHDLSVALSDHGGGLTAVSVLVNGIPAASQPFACSVAHGVAFNFRPCPPVASPSFALDTQRYPFHDGPNSVQVCAADLATDSAPNLSCRPEAPLSVEVDNSCEASPVAGGTQIAVAFEGADGAAIESGSRDGARIVGRLTDARGYGVGGARLCVSERTMLPGWSAWPTGSVLTGDDGSFAYEVQPGPSREIGFGYRHDREQIAASASIHSRAVPSLELSRRRVRNGRAIRLFGALPGPEAAARVVVFQARGPRRRRWHTFRRAETDAQGRFAARYRFRRTIDSTTYRIRAVVPAQSGYPYLQGRSAPRRVRVIGSD
jgi:hypothetical protein